MALVFSLYLSCSPECLGTEGRPQQAFCCLWVGSGVRWPIDCVFVTPVFDARSMWGSELRCNKSKRVQFPSAENFNANENGIFRCASTVFWEKTILRGSAAAVCP